MRNADCGLRNGKSAFLCPMNYQTLELAINGQVATVTLIHPEVFNAFKEAIEELAGCVSLNAIRQLRITDRGFPIPQSAIRNPHFSAP
jgi:hypothetical protein